jgi:prepilin peptidase CpaA
MTAHQWMILAALVVAAAAAWTDFRTGEMPNRITLVPLALAPVIHAAIGFAAERSVKGAFAAAGSSIFGAALCLIVPIALYRAGAMGGGDTKLFAAIGAIGRVEFGIYAETYAFVFGMLYAVALVIHQGKLASTLGNVVAIFRGAARSRAGSTPADSAPAEMTQVRFGPAILAGVVATALLHWSIP